MLRQTSWVCRSCAAFSRSRQAQAQAQTQAQWAFGARHQLYPRLSRSLGTSPVNAHAAHLGEDGNEPPGNAPPGPPPGRGAHTTPETKKPTLQNRPRQVKVPPVPKPPMKPQRAGEDSQTQPKRRSAREARQSLTEPNVSKGWELRKNRLALHLPALEYVKKTTGKKKEVLIAGFRIWDREFYRLWERLQNARGPDLELGEVPTDQWKFKRLMDFESVEEMRSWWFGKPATYRDRYWLRAMMLAMKRAPDRTAQFLEATLDQRTITPTWAVADVLSFLVKWSSLLPPEPRTAQRAALSQLLLHVLNNTSPRDFQFHQWVISEIISGCTPAAAAEIHVALRRYEHPLHFNTKLKIGGILAKDGKYKLAALQLLEEVLKDPAIGANDRRCAALATEVFYLPKRWEEGRESPVEAQLIAEAFERVVRLGLSPSVVTYTSMIRTLCLTDRLDTALKIYDVMREQASVVDGHVCSVLLNGAKRAGRLDVTIRVIEDAPRAALQSPFLWNDMIHTVLEAAAQESQYKLRRNFLPAIAFSFMLQVYSRFFKLEHLEALLSSNLQSRLTDWHEGSGGEAQVWDWKAKLDVLLQKLPPVTKPEALREPGIDTLNIMLLGYMKLFSTAPPALSFYSHFRGLLRQRHPVAIALLKHSTLPYDVVLRCITSIPGMLRVAIDIVGDMLKDAADSAAALSAAGQPNPVLAAAQVPLESDVDLAEKPAPVPSESDVDAAKENPAPEQKATAAAFYHPPPSSHTWTTLLQAFARQRQPRHAHNIIDVMRSHGVEPSRVTWNQLIFSHARAQDTKAVKDLLERFDLAGFHPDIYTLRAVTKLAKSEALIDWLEERSAEREDERWREIEAAAELPPNVEGAEEREAFRRAREAQRRERISPVREFWTLHEVGFQHRRYVEWLRKTAPSLFEGTGAGKGEKAQDEMDKLAGHRADGRGVQGKKTKRSYMELFDELSLLDMVDKMEGISEDMKKEGYEEGTGKEGVKEVTATEEDVKEDTTKEDVKEDTAKEDAKQDTPRGDVANVVTPQEARQEGQ